MTEDDEREIRSLEFRLSRALDDCRRAQRALTVARGRLGLFDPRKFCTADEMAAERAAARAEMREIVGAAISQTRILFDRAYVPTAWEKSLLELGRSFAQEAKRAKIERGNVVPLPRGQTAQQIIAAGRRRRGETQR
jgi:hypothetical protein